MTAGREGPSRGRDSTLDTHSAFGAEDAVRLCRQTNWLVSHRRGVIRTARSWREDRPGHYSGNGYNRHARRAASL